MLPGKYNFVCPQGSTFSQQLTWKIGGEPVDLDGYSARMKVKESLTSTSSVLDLTTENNKIILGGSYGTILILIDSSETNSIYPTKYIYDLELISVSLEVTRLIEGKFIVTAGVTD